MSGNELFALCLLASFIVTVNANLNRGNDFRGAILHLPFNSISTEKEAWVHVLHLDEQDLLLI